MIGHLAILTFTRNILLNKYLSSCFKAGSNSFLAAILFADEHWDVTRSGVKTVASHSIHT